MEYSEYRSTCLKLLWPEVYKELELEQENVCRLPKFSTSEIDNICANNWKADNPEGFCARELFDYIELIW